ncbi:bifunctional riboflavin kinase/FAD synthetase [Candidatus Deferrimicrobium sp.]|uniref:bifunctional riboflavin kinase/FAD synthetase n=1 Tax=Candidatus Deferrimicrobium sp. TaxID=3060586 RepID=UPI003C5E260F
MEVIEGSGNFSPPGETSLTIGNFDGVHLGHRELLRRAVAHARDLRLEAVALTFTPHPVRFFTPKARFYEITSMGEKAARMEELGIDVLVVEAFTGAIGGMGPEEFARTVIHERLRARVVTVGYDFTFGRNRTGSPVMLRRIGSELGFDVDVVPPLLRGGEIVSSSRIRDLLLSGRVREAEELLCRPYAVSGRVIPGTARGRKLGFPTANVEFVQELLPMPGVYVIDAAVGGVVRRGVANVGFSPTFGENSLAVEAHLIDFAGDLYGQEMTVRFRDRIRDERKFKSVEELVRQIEKDVGYARSVRLATHPGTDDAASGRRREDGRR